MSIGLFATRGVLLLAGALVLASCKTVQTTQPGRVGVDRQQTMMLASSTVNREAGKAYAQTMREASKKGLLNRDAAQVARVRAVARRLVPATAAFRKDAPGWAWEVNVIASKEINAWCMPGGKMAVYSGIVERLKLTDDELAAIMGHEMAHALREHGRERASQALAQSLGLAVLGAALGLNEASLDLVGVITDVTISLPNSREHEREADRIGVELAARAGYDPRAAVTLWQKMSGAGGGQPPQFLSTHPSHQARIQDLKAYSGAVMSLYLKSKQP
jgi:Zn-dependent protease with chaperone function